MSVFEKYKLKRPSEFTRLVGVNFGTFQIILDKLEAEIIRFKQQKPMRQRGLKSSLTIADQFLLTLIYLRQYHTFLQLGEMFSISESYAQKRYTFISKHLMKALDLPDDKALTAENLKLVADVTEQESNAPPVSKNLIIPEKKETYHKNAFAGLFPDRLNSFSSLCPRDESRFPNLEKQ